MNVRTSPSREVDRLIALGAVDIDRRLRGGLCRAALHEIVADVDDAGAATGFAFLLAIRAATIKPIFVIRDDRCVQSLGRIHGDGIAALGGNPASVVVVHTLDIRSTLRAAADALSTSEIGSVIIEPWRATAELDLTTSRRLALRAEQSGVFALMVKVGCEPVPSAATSRWRVAGAPSTALAANAPGHPAFDISLLRHRHGIAGFNARLEWRRDQRSFRDTPLSCIVPAVAAGRTSDSDERRAA